MKLETKRKKMGGGGAVPRAPPTQRLAAWQPSLLPQAPFFPDCTQSIADALELDFTPYTG